ncbi:hypothetical protein K491DRAFT_721407 [Lophiostoma macrostomum CBS 122681]|uniref:BTB domain-containing protein n=1 Tax=Lophiostoma macrostomum CBS 122681 TaxID=1314788 RepID=A0A6A6SQC6_9PLEO|nr:hypothetical protein K491DRAFT_721407 [Lophiostoma macrostomum CBS 122681]
MVIWAARKYPVERIRGVTKILSYPYTRLDDHAIKYGGWYKNPSMADVTVLYGAHGERVFSGHRCVLENTSDTMFKAGYSVSEPQEVAINLGDDDPAALESLFEFAYLHHYTVPFGSDIETQLCAHIDHHIKVLVLAHKYAADLLQAYALEKFDYLLDIHDNLDLGHRDHIALAHVVPRLYRTPSIFGPRDSEPQVREQFETLSLQAQPQQENSTNASIVNENDPDSEMVWSSCGSKDEALDEDEEEFPDWNEVSNPKGTPFEYLKLRALDFSVELWHCEEGCEPLRKMAVEIPEYASDLALHALSRGCKLEYR